MGQQFRTPDGSVYEQQGSQYVLVSGGQQQPSAQPNSIVTRPADPVARDRARAELTGQQLRNRQMQEQLTGGQDAGLDTTTIDMLAHQYAMTGNLPPMGMGRSATAARQAILNRAAQIAGVNGQTGENQAIAFSRYRNGVNAIGQQERLLGAVRGNEGAAVLNGQQYIDRSREIPLQTRFPLVNSVTQSILRHTGNTAVSEADAAYGTFINEYNRVVAGSPSGAGTLSDSSRHEMMDILRSNASPEQKAHAFQQMQRDMENRVNALQANIAGGYQNLEGGRPASSRPPEAAAPTTSAAQMSPSLRARPGETLQFNDEAPGAQAEVVTDADRAFAAEAESLFNSGATREQMNALSASRGRAPWGPDFERAIIERDQHGARGQVGAVPTLTPEGRRAQELDRFGGQQGLGRQLQHGAVLGLDDEAAGVAGIIRNAVVAPFSSSVDFDPAGAYRFERDVDRIRLQGARDRGGWLGTGAEVAGSLLSLRPGLAGGGGAGGIGGSPTLGSRFRALGGRMMTGARSGAAIGAGYGFGEGEGAQGSLVGSLTGAAGGGILGAGAPVLGAGLRMGGRGARGLTRIIRGVNPEVAPRAVGQAIDYDASTPRLVAQQMQEAQANGVPAMIADSGENARGLLAASARAPGRARTVAGSALDERQAGLHDRVTGAIERDLGPVTDPHQVSEQLMTGARAKAGPLYEAAYSVPGAPRFADNVRELLGRPSMRNAMSRARAIADEEGRDPTAMGFDFDAEGNVVLGRGPSWQTLDYVKRGLDDVIESGRNEVTGRLRLDEVGRAVNDTQREFLRQIDAANPAYAQARAAYAGPARANGALSRGLKSLNMSADDIAHNTENLAPHEMDLFRHGMRRAMAERVASLGDNADVVRALVGTGKRRAALARVFGGGAQFDRFVSTLQAEQRGFETFRKARLGSPTAANVQDDNALNSAAIAGALDLVSTGGAATALNTTARAINIGRGRIANNAQQEIAAILSENSPARLLELAREARRQAVRGNAARNRGRRNAVAAGGIFGHLAGEN